MATTPAQSKLRINEIMAANASYSYDNDFYNFSDWLEIYNSGSSSESLSNYYLTDEIDDLKKWKLPGPRPVYSIPAGRLDAAASLSLDGDNVRYTTNGSEPNLSKTIYNDSPFRKRNGFH